MKDKVFIAWSGSNSVARKVRDILRFHGYEGIVGGNDNNGSTHFTIGEVVISQIKSCNQAILILQKKGGEEIVSSNLFFEMGYVFSRYGAQKVHAVKQKNEVLNIPTDIENFFIEPVCDFIEIDGENIFNEDIFAKGIVDYFLKRQQLTIGGSKMELISDYNKLLRFIQGKDKCSTYELAQYVLYFMQSAYLFDEVDEALKELDQMCCHLGGVVQNELAVAVDICRAYFGLVNNIKVVENTDKLFMDATAYYDYEETVDNLLLEIVDLIENNKRIKDEYGNIENNLEEYIFGSLAKLFLCEHMTYACVLCTENPQESVENKNVVYDTLLKYAKAALDEITLLSNNKNFWCDRKGLFSLCTAYITRNKFFAYRGMEQNPENISEAEKALAESYRCRMDLLEQYKNKVLDSKLYSYFHMEQHLLLVDRVKYFRSLSPTKYRDRINKDLYRIVEYAKELQKEQSQTRYNKKILAFYLEVCSESQKVNATERYVEEMIEAVVAVDDADNNEEKSKIYESTVVNN